MEMSHAESPLTVSRLSNMSTTTPLPNPTPVPQNKISPVPPQARTPQPQARTPQPQGKTPQPQARTPQPPQPTRSPYPQSVTPSQKTVIVKKVVKKQETEEDSDDDEDKGRSFFSKLEHGDFACVIAEQFILLCICLPMIIIGATNLSNCPIRSFIPIWLLVAGIFWLLHGLINGVLKCGGLVEMEESMSKGRKMTLIIINIIFGIVQLLWLFIGAIVVYGVSDVNYSSSSGSYYCRDIVYLYAWWLITLIVVSVFGGLFIVCFLYYCFKTC